MLVWELITRHRRSQIHPALTYEPHQACIRARSAPPPARSHAGANSARNVLCRCCSAPAPVRTARWPRPAPPHHPLRQQEWPGRGVPRPPCRRPTHNMDLRMWGAIEEPHMRATSAGFQTQQYIRSFLWGSRKTSTARRWSTASSMVAYRRDKEVGRSFQKRLLSAHECQNLIG